MFNFKTLNVLLLPEAMKGVSIDQIFKMTVSDKIVLQKITTRGFHLCVPGKSLFINKTWQIDMGKLWFILANSLGKGLSSFDFMEKLFKDPEKARQNVVSFLIEAVSPTTIGDIPGDIANAIAGGASLDQLVVSCSRTILGKRVCASGIFFKRLWERDVRSVDDFFDSNSRDEEAVFPGKVKENSQWGLNVPIWFYDEDLNKDIGPGVMAYNWNYNRFLDINTSVYWLILKMLEVDIEKKQNPLLPVTQYYNPNKHMEMMRHRFTNEQLRSFDAIHIYTYGGELRLELTFDGKGGMGFLNGEMTAAIDSQRVKNSAKRIVQKVQKIRTKLGLGIRGGIPKFSISFKGGIMHGFPMAWYILVFISSLLRYLIKEEEFVFFSFVSKK